MKNTVFKFENYNFNPASGIAVFNYSLGKNKFREELVFPKGYKKLSAAKAEAFDKALFNLFLIAGVSYYKTYCPPEIDLNDFKLSQGQAEFWDKIYTKGLGEFFYKNKINFKNLINFPYHKNYRQKSVKIKTSPKSLVPLGGGKDSIVTMELLKKKNINFDLFSLRDLKISRDVAVKANKKILIIDRNISPNLFKLKNAYNGHIPFSAYLAFLSVVISILYDYKNIVLSNEKSANYGNLKYLGFTINHQWSKSYEFEKLFGNYLKKYITPDIKYYSLLRSWDELKITQEFVKYKKYFPVFSSCNKNFRLKQKAAERWCGECAKCVFTWTMLTAYLPVKQVENIFNKNLYQNKKLKPLFNQLLGKKKIKPFECVGTPSEMKRALKKYDHRHSSSL